MRSRFNALGEWHDEYATPVAGLTAVVDGVVEWNVFTPTRSTSAEWQDADSHHAAHRDSCCVQTPRTLSHGIALACRKVEDGEQGQGDGVRAKDARFALYQSRVLARYLLWDIWIRLESRYDCRAFWEADGQVHEVRLKMSLVGFDHDED